MLDLFHFSLKSINPLELFGTNKSIKISDLQPSVVTNTIDQMMGQLAGGCLP
jgi:hypothetical protein